MPDELTDTEPLSLQVPDDRYKAPGSFYQAATAQEQVFAALALLLGPETEDHVRARAARQLTHHGPQLLPLLLSTLNSQPEITTPPWPWWPPQYELCGRLLLRLSKKAQLKIEILPHALLHHPAISQPVGPVLWTSVIEAVSLLPLANYEAFLRASLTASWNTVRYTAAMTLAQLAGKTALSQETLDALHNCQHEDVATPVRLAVAYALLRNNDSQGIEDVMRLMDAFRPEETRKAAVFVLAAEPPVQLSSQQRMPLIQRLLKTLDDQNEEISGHAAHALSSLALPSTLPALCAILDSGKPQAQIAAMMALEEMARRKTRRWLIDTLPAHIAPLLKSEDPEVRRQAGYTLAALGGPYAMGVLSANLLKPHEAGYLETIEALRLLRGALRASMRSRIVYWLLTVLSQPEEEVQAIALDSLAYIAWQARARGQKKAYQEISDEIWREGTAFQLLGSASAWVRQRAIELLTMLDGQHQPETFHSELLSLLHSDSDSGVRACAAYTLGQMGERARWAIADLIQALLDLDEYVAETALNSLGRIATPDDIIVVSILRDLAMRAYPAKGEEHRLAEAATALLREWQKK